MNIFPKLFSFYGNNLFSYLFLTLIFLCSFSINSFAQEEDEKENDPIAFFNQGQDAHEKGNFKTALENYDKALKLAPEFPEAEYQKGNALRSLGKNKEAEESFKKAIELREDWTLPMSALGALLVERGDLNEAEKIINNAIKLDEQNLPAYSVLVELKLKTKAAPEILQTLLNKMKYFSMKANPTAAIWASRAALENVLGDINSAKTSLNRALEIDPNHISALNERVEIAFTENDLARADEIIKKLSQIAPTSPNVRFLQARNFAANGKLEDALKILESIENPTENVSTLREKIIANNTINTVDLEKQIEKDPKNATALGRLCMLLRTENPLKAIDYCRRANEAEPTNIYHAIGFGAALVQARKFPEAVGVFNRLKAYDAENYTVRANLATALFQLKRYADAKKEYVWLTEKQPELPIAYYFLAISHDQLGEYLDAMANYQLFMKFADKEKNNLELEKVNLRLPVLQKLIKEKKGKK